MRKIWRYLFGTNANLFDIKHKVAATPFIVGCVVNHQLQVEWQLTFYFIYLFSHLADIWMVKEQRLWYKLAQLLLPYIMSYSEMTEFTFNRALGWKTHITLFFASQSPLQETQQGFFSFLCPSSNAMVTSAGWLGQRMNEKVTKAIFI